MFEQLAPPEGRRCFYALQRGEIPLDISRENKLQ